MRRIYTMGRVSQGEKAPFSPFLGLFCAFRGRLTQQMVQYFCEGFEHPCHRYFSRGSQRSRWWNFGSLSDRHKSGDEYDDPPQEKQP
jgi:hypothetical protein